MKQRAFTVIEALVVLAIVALTVGIIVSAVGGCEQKSPTAAAPTTSSTGVRQARADVQVNSDGHTVEQMNIVDRLALENLPGSIKHLYVYSAMSGDIILYSTVKGKVTSSGKRMSPYTVAYGWAGRGGGYGGSMYGVPVNVGGEMYRTGEVLQDDGTYGSSIPYLYWWDAAGIYHQHYVAGGQVIHLSDQPIEAGAVELNVRGIDD